MLKSEFFSFLNKIGIPICSKLQVSFVTIFFSALIFAFFVANLHKMSDKYSIKIGLLSFSIIERRKAYLFFEDESEIISRRKTAKLCNFAYAFFCGR